MFKCQVGKLPMKYLGCACNLFTCENNWLGLPRC
jgi:hypothetical protein